MSQAIYLQGTSLSPYDSLRQIEAIFDLANSLV